MTKRRVNDDDDDRENENENEPESDSPITITSTPHSIWLDIDGTTFQLSHIAVYRSAGDGRTAIWTPGQSSIDGGFLVDVDVNDITDAIREAALQQAMQLRAIENGGANVDNSDSYNALAAIAMNRNKFD